MKYENQNIFFISDFHLCHKNILKYDQRPFTNIDEMHNELIQRWNSVVGDNDVVYYLGDLTFGRSETTKWFVSQLKGKIYFIMGNHDKMKEISNLNRFEKIHEYGTEIYVKDEDSKATRSSQGYQQIILSHYPILSWNRSHHASFHLHGHCHGSLMKSNPDYYKRMVIDVGCNSIDYTPVSYSQVKEIMNSKIISSVDHHE